MPHFVATRQADTESVRQLQDKLLGYPSRGVQAGGGIHVPAPETWDGTGDCPPGWTATYSVPARHPVRLEWAVELHPDLAGEITRNGSRLTAGERGQLTAALAAAGELPADWHT